MPLLAKCMEDLGILLYGYDEDSAMAIKNNMDEIHNSDIILLSASDREKSIVDDVLREGGSRIFEKKNDPFMMFLGFSDKSIEQTLAGLEVSDRFERPIFCGLTQQNIRWSVEALHDHLIEERRKFRQS